MISEVIPRKVIKGEIVCYRVEKHMLESDNNVNLMRYFTLKTKNVIAPVDKTC